MAYHPGDVGFPPTIRPTLHKGFLAFRDGQIHWLTLKERFLLWIGQETALSLEVKLRPELYGRT